MKKSFTIENNFSSFIKEEKEIHVDDVLRKATPKLANLYDVIMGNKKQDSIQFYQDQHEFAIEFKKLFPNVSSLEKALVGKKYYGDDYKWEIYPDKLMKKEKDYYATVEDIAKQTLSDFIKIALKNRMEHMFTRDKESFTNVSGNILDMDTKKAWKDELVKQGFSTTQKGINQQLSDLLGQFYDKNKK